LRCTPCMRCSTTSSTFAAKCDLLQTSLNQLREAGIRGAELSVVVHTQARAGRQYSHERDRPPGLPAPTGRLRCHRRGAPHRWVPCLQSRRGNRSIRRSVRREVPDLPTTTA
jgi:hypothetical protein